MTKRNIHGLWSMDFEDRILHSKLHGAANEEACLVWREQLQDKLLSSPEGDKTPWVSIIDTSGDWDGFTVESWPVINDTVVWQAEHNCALIVVVITKELHNFTHQKYVSHHEIITAANSHEEAYQICIDKLAEVTSRNT
ncbi:hypothetical protein L4C34_17285 [Vibrio profundum]|uniref:hypothetical protein n=1 Tax=Vibrio profundum TaxID=2910247 RepID=UPI003D145C5E